MSFFRSFRKSSSGDENTAANAASSSPARDGTAPDTEGEPMSPPPAAGPPSPPAAAADDNNDVAGPNIVVEDEPTDDPVRVELEGQVRQRDASISALEKARAEKQQELEKLQAELEQERLSQMKESLTHKIESERIKRQTKHAEERLQALEADMQDKAAIHEYANLIKGVAPKSGVDSQYVMKLQTQLQKAVKKMETTNTQMAELEQHSQAVVETLSADIADLVQDRCRTELELRKQMEALQSQKRDMQIQYETRIRENLQTLEKLRVQAASQVTLDEIEEELEETETRLEELHTIHEKQERTIAQLRKSMASNNGVDGPPPAAAAAAAAAH